MTFQTTLNNERPPFYLIAGIGVAACITSLAYIYTTLFFEINWDEFFYLDWVYQWKRGDLNLTLQTIFLRAFTWLPFVSENEVDQIVAGRLVMMILLTASCAMLWSISRRFYSARATALALLTFLSFSFVFRHGTSFRADMVITTLSICVLWLIMKKQLSLRHLIFGGVIFGLAGMVSIKAVFYAPTIGAIVLIRSIKEGPEKSITLPSIVFKPLLIGGTSILSFCLFYVLHALTVPAAESSLSYLSHVTNDSLLETSFFPRWDYFKFSVSRNIFHWVILLIGGAVLLGQTFNKETRGKALICLTFALPLLTLLFYAHAYPYYYVFMLAPVTVVMAAAYDAPFFKKESIRNLIPLVFLVLSLFALISRGTQQTLTVQKRVIAATHSIFPKGTPYIDRCAMISSSPKSGLFMSSWFMQTYKRKNDPIFDNILRQEAPKYILANIQSLDLDNITDETLRRFLPADEAVLKDNFVHHWGPIYVAGKTVALRAQQKTETVILIEGTYTLHAQEPVTIDGQRYESGDVLELGPQILRLESSQNQTVILRWGNNLARPDMPEPNKVLFHGF